MFAAQQWTTVLRLVVPDLDGDRAAEIHTLIEDVQAEIDAGARAVASTRRVYRRLAALSGNRYFIELLADIDIAVEHHLLRAEDGSDVRTRVKKHLSALDAAIARGDAAGAVRIAVQLHEDATPAAA